MEDPLVPRDVFDLQIDIPSFLDDAVVHLAYICPFRGSWIPTVGSSCCGRRLPASHWTPTCFSPAPPACTSPAGSKACVGGRWTFPAQSSSPPSTPSSSVGLFHQTPWNWVAMTIRFIPRLKQRMPARRACLFSF